MFIQDLLFIIDDIFEQRKTSKNIFTRDTKVKKRLEKVKSILNKRSTKVDYDLIDEFVSIYNSTYEFININNSRKERNSDSTMEFNVADDTANSIKYFQISYGKDDKCTDIYLYLRKNKEIGFVCRNTNNLCSIPITMDFNNVLVCDESKDSKMKEFVETIADGFVLALNTYVLEYIDYKINKLKNKS